MNKNYNRAKNEFFDLSRKNNTNQKEKNQKTEHYILDRKKNFQVEKRKNEKFKLQKKGNVSDLQCNSSFLKNRPVHVLLSRFYPDFNQIKTKENKNRITVKFG